MGNGADVVIAATRAGARTQGQVVSGKVPANLRRNLHGDPCVQLLLWRGEVRSDGRTGRDPHIDPVHGRLMGHPPPPEAGAALARC